MTCFENVEMISQHGQTVESYDSGVLKTGLGLRWYHKGLKSPIVEHSLKSK